MHVDHDIARCPPIPRLVVYYPEQERGDALHTAERGPAPPSAVGILHLPEAAVGAAHKDVDLTGGR
jgi:hypothetical protein